MALSKTISLYLMLSKLDEVAPPMSEAAYEALMRWTPPDGLSVPKWRC